MRWWSTVTCCVSVLLASSQFDFTAHAVSLRSCVDTRRGSRSRCRSLLEQPTTAPSGHIRSIRSTGTDLQTACVQEETSSPGALLNLVNGCETHAVMRRIIWLLWLYVECNKDAASWPSDLAPDTIITLSPEQIDDNLNTTNWTKHIEIIKITVSTIRVLLPLLTC